MKLCRWAWIGVWVAVACIVSAPVGHAQSRSGIVTVRLETVTGQPLAAVHCTVISFGWGVPRGEGQATIAEGQTDAHGQIAFDVSRWPRASYELDFRVAGQFGHGVLLDVDSQSHTLAFAYDPDTNTLTEETINGIALPPPPADKNGDGGAANRVPPADPARMTAYVPTYAAYLTQGAPTTTPKPAIPPTASFTLAAPQGAVTAANAPGQSATTRPNTNAELPIFVACMGLLAAVILATRRGRQMLRRSVRQSLSALAARQRTTARSLPVGRQRPPSEVLTDPYDEEQD